MRLVKDNDKTERQKILFEIADQIYDDVFQYSIKCINNINRPELEEMQDFEVISFFANLYTKIFCHGFHTMLELKRKIMKEHESTERQLLDEWVDGIYVFLGQSQTKAKSTFELPDGIKRL